MTFRIDGFTKHAFFVYREQSTDDDFYEIRAWGGNLSFKETTVSFRLRPRYTPPRTHTYHRTHSSFALAEDDKSVATYMYL